MRGAWRQGWKSIAPGASYQGFFVLARHIPLPSFFSTKRTKAITVAVAGTLTLATVISVGAAIASSASPMPATDTAFITTVGQQNAAQTTRSAGADLVDKARDLQVQRHAQQVAAAKAAAAKVAATKAAATKTAATKAAATRAAALKAAAAKAAAANAAERKAAAEKAAAVQKAHRAQQAAATTPSGTPQQIAQQMLGKYGWSQSQFSCLQPLWFHESGWNLSAENPSSGAYGIPQALPGAQMASAGADWRTNAATQIHWGLNYIQSRYGSPCGAWAHEQADNWY